MPDNNGKSGSGDDDIRDLVWNATVCIDVCTSPPETVGTHHYLLVARRVSYLSLYVQRIVDYFARYVENSSSVAVGTPSRWFLECNGERLPWNRPTGLLYDLFAKPSSEPWQLTLRYAPPDSQTLPVAEPLVDSIREYWTNQFKEAAYIRDGSANAVLSLSRDASQALWQSIADDGPAKDFWRHAGPLLRTRDMRHVPLKVYTPATSPVRSVQKLVHTRNENGDLVTVAEACVLLGPFEQKVVTIHGVEVDINAPLAELYDEATYPDGFLHLLLA